jgi:hypothetical protein
MPADAFPIRPPSRRWPFAATLVLAGALLLAGCYASDDLLLDPAEAAHPLPDGVYVRQGDDADRFRLTLEPDGWYSVERIDARGLLGETHRVLANPVGDGFALADEGPDGFRYAFARVSGVRLYLSAPDCADPLDRDDAEDQGATEGDMPGACRFASRGALTAALAAFSAHADIAAPFVKRAP